MRERADPAGVGLVEVRSGAREQLDHARVVAMLGDPPTHTISFQDIEGQSRCVCKKH